MHLEKKLDLIRLNPDEVACLKKCAQGISDEQIGTQLVLNAKDVKTLFSSTLKKLDAQNRLAAIAKAIRLGILDISTF